MTESVPPDDGVDADRVVRRVAEQAAAALAEAWIRTAVLEAQLAATRQAQHTPEPAPEG